MKKILLILTVLFSLSAIGQVKISQMPYWSGSMDSAYIPIVVNLVNYKTLSSRVNQDRIDSIVNNWPAGGGSLFAVSGQDDQATQVRSFDQNGFIFTWGNGGYTTMTAPFTRIDFDDNYQWFQSDNNAGTYYSALFSIPGEQISLTAGTSAGTSQLDLHSGDGIYISQSSGIVYVPNLASATTANVVYYNTSTGLLTYGAAAGGGGGSGIQSIEGNNGVTVLTDSIVQLGSATAGASTFTAIRYIDATSSYYLDLTGNAAYTLRVHTTANRAIYGEASGAGVAVTGQVASGFAGVGVQGTADNASSTGVQGNSVSGIGTSGSTGTGWAGSFGAEPSSTNTSVGVLRVLRSTSGTAANNIGGYISFWMEYSSPTTVDEAARIGATFTDVSNRTSDLNFTTKNANSIVETMTLKGGGNLTLNTTGKAYGLKSPDGTMWYITVSDAGVLSTSTTAP